jgi:hypothetical protein
VFLKGKENMVWEIKPILATILIIYSTVKVRTGTSREVAAVQSDELNASIRKNMGHWRKIKKTRFAPLP